MESVHREIRLKQKDIVLLPVPFSDQSSRKVRPAIVISNDSINSTSEDLILVPLTSVLKDVPYSILLNQKDLVEGKLITLSRIRVDKIFTAHKSLIKLKIGIIKNDILNSIKVKLSKIIWELSISIIISRSSLFLV